MIIGVYAPEEGKDEETISFYSTLQNELEKFNKKNSVIIMGDLNARVGTTPITNLVGTFGENVKNKNGDKLREFATFNELKITNTFFRKKEIHKFTWAAHGTRSLINYVIANGKISRQVTDVNVLRGFDVFSDHYLVVSKIVLYARWKKANKKGRKMIMELIIIKFLKYTY